MFAIQQAKRSRVKISVAATTVSLALLACATLFAGDPPTPVPDTPVPDTPVPASTETAVPEIPEIIDLGDLDLTEVAIEDLIPGGLPTELGEAIPIVSQWHIEEGTAASDWNSDPPTSGEHYPRWAPAGFNEEVIVDEYLVHNLEHGYIIIYYNCEGMSDDACGIFKIAIQAAMAAAGNDPDTLTPKLVAVPRPGMPNPITYTAWGRLYAADVFAPDELVTFVLLYRSLAPEGSLP